MQFAKVHRAENKMTLNSCKRFCLLSSQMLERKILTIVFVFYALEYSAHEEDLFYIGRQSVLQREKSRCH